MPAVARFPSSRRQHGDPNRRRLLAGYERDASYSCASICSKDRFLLKECEQATLCQRLGGVLGPTAADRYAFLCIEEMKS